jgi:hypothetical protein
VAENSQGEIYGWEGVFLGCLWGDTVEEGLVEGWGVGEEVDTQRHVRGHYKTINGGVWAQREGGHPQALEVKFGENMGGDEGGAN